MPGKCVFNADLVKSYPWIKECKDCKFKAICTVCRKDIDLCKMGELALKSHAKSQKHKKNVQIGSSTKSPMDNYFQVRPPKSETASSETPSTAEMFVPHPPTSVPVTAMGD